MTALRWVCLTVGLLVAVSMPVFAHKPVSIGGIFPSFESALLVTDIDVSQVVYSPLSPSNPHLWLVLQASAGDRLDVSLGIPVLDRLGDYRPQLAVLGPGLPSIALDFATPDGVGGVVFQSAAIAAPRFFHEPFTGTDSWILLEDTVVLPETGTYYVVAWPAGEQTDKLWVAIGTREQFGWRDFLSFPAIIRDARAFHEVGDKPHALATLSKLVFLGLAAALIGWLAFKGR